MISYEEFLLLPTDDPARQKAAKLKLIADEVVRAKELRAWLEREGFQVELVTDPGRAHEVAGLANAAGVVGFDLETAPANDAKAHPLAGLDPRVTQVRVVSIAIPGTVFVVAVADAGLEWLGAINAKLVAHNAAFDLAHLFAQDGVIRDFDCTMLMDRAIGSENRALKDLARARLGLSLGKALQVSEWTRRPLLAEQIEYAAADAVVALRLHESLGREVCERDAAAAYALLRGQVYPTIRQAGVRLDIHRHAEWYQHQAEVIERSAGECAALGISNLNSAPQKQAYLAQVLPPHVMASWPLTDSGALSTAREHLLAARDVPGLAALADHAGAKHLTANFGMKLQELAVGGVLRPSFRIAGAKSGRYTCNSPNLQNLPRGDFKDFILPEHEGHIFVCADYSQIELRVAAYIADEAVMLDAFRNGDDLHRIIGERGAEMLGRADLPLRAVGKVINFGLLFGGGAKMLVDFASSTYGLSLSLHDATTLRELFRASYPSIVRWQEKAVHDARMWGFTETLYSRLRVAVDQDTYSLALNAPVQGTAAEILMLALSRLPGALPEGWKTAAHVHDEIVLSGPEDTAAEAAERLGQIMVGAFEEVLPGAPSRGLIDTHTGATWKEAK